MPLLTKAAISLYIMAASQSFARNKKSAADGAFLLFNRWSQIFNGWASP